MMKKWILGMSYVFFLMVLSHPALAQDAHGPKMVLKEREFDFKEVREGEGISHAFAVINQGDEALKIIRVKPG